MTILDASAAVQLDPSVHMPRVGLGVFRSGSGDGTKNAVRWALEAGYRHIDTAAVYRNEVEVGQAIHESEVDRGDVFVTTKLWRDDYGFDTTLRAFDASLERLGLDQLDLYLMHWPSPETRVETWRAMVEIRNSGRCRAIGVSNFGESHLEELIAETGVTPQVNQVELHPFLQQPRLVEFCSQRNIAVQAWAPLTKAQRLDDPTLIAISTELGKSPAQILIRWSLQRGFVVLPKSSNRDRIFENFDVFDFELSAKQMQRLHALDEGYRTAPGWDPSTVA